MLKRFNEETELDASRSAQVAQARDLVCAQCAAPVTSEPERISINGAHTHAVVNPHEIRFEIGCFRSAPGCRCTGAATLEFTWFPGFSWRIALCARCQTHLGWGYSGSGPNTAFFGLIIERLRSSHSA